jgi:hypothetical protein
VKVIKPGEGVDIALHNLKHPLDIARSTHATCPKTLHT